MLKYIPNILTIIRFLLIPFIIFFALQDNYTAVILVFTLSGITDILDGAIARKYNFTTDFGRLVDPLADKCTQISLLGVLTFKKVIPVWIVIIVIVKELLSIIGAIVLYKKQLVTSSKWYRKACNSSFLYSNYLFNANKAIQLEL